MKTYYLLALNILLCGAVWAQPNEVDRHQYTIGLATNHNYNLERWGVSGYFKWLLPSHNFEGHRVVFTAKATHTPARDGGHFFTGFDGGNYNNISAVHLLGGYRFHFWDKHRFAGPTVHPRRHAWYLEFSAGGTYIGYDQSIAIALSPLIGYSFDATFDFTIGHHGSFGKTDLHLAEFGVAYSF